MGAIVYPLDLHHRSESIQAVELNSRKLFVEFIVEYLNKTKRGDRYKSAYDNLIMHVENFCQLKSIDNLYTDDLGAEFCENFVEYLRGRELMQNTIRGLLEKLNAMIHKSAMYRYPIDNTYLEVKVPEEEIDSIFLTMTEITRIYYYTGLTRSECEIRDYFIIGCLTGLRYSDFSRLNETNFIKETNHIRIRAKKTGAPVFVPMHRFVKEILKKYNYILPRCKCIPHFNKTLQAICKKIGIDDKILFERTIGNQIVRKTMEKWQLIGSHTARRSFATNTFLSGIPCFRIMLITGHKSEKNFFKYVRITREENARALSSHLFFQ